MIPQTIQLLVTEVICPMQWYSEATSEVCQTFSGKFRLLFLNIPDVTVHDHNLWPVFWKLLHYYNITTGELWTSHVSTELEQQNNSVQCNCRRKWRIRRIITPQNCTREKINLPFIFIWLFKVSIIQTFLWVYCLSNVCRP